MHHDVLDGPGDRWIDIFGGHADDGGVQGVHRSPAASVKVLVTVIRSRPAILRTDDSSTSYEFVAGHDRAVLLEDFFGLHVRVVTDDYRFEHARLQAIAGIDVNVSGATRPE